MVLESLTPAHNNADFRFEIASVQTDKSILFEMLVAAGTTSPEEIEARRMGLIDAFTVADQAFAESDKPRRLTGEETVCHSLRVALNLAFAGIDDIEVLQAAILHDVDEDTTFKLDKIREQFGDSVATLVDAVTSIKSNVFESQPDGRDSLQDKDARNLEKIFESLVKDPRALYIKISDVLDNSWTWSVHADISRQKRKASIALNYYEPLARRLGLRGFARLIGDHALEIVQPVEYLQLRNLREQSDAPNIADTIIDALYSANFDRKGIEAYRSKVNVLIPSVYDVYRDYSMDTVTVESFIPQVEIVADTASEAAQWEILLLEQNLIGINGNENSNILFVSGQPVHRALTLREGERITRVPLTIHTRRSAVVPADLQVSGQVLTEQETVLAIEKLDAIRRYYELTIAAKSQIADEMAEMLQSDWVTVYAGPKREKFTFKHGATPLDLAYALGRDLGHLANGATVVRLGETLPVDLGQPLQSGDHVSILKNPELEKKKNKRLLYISPRRFDQTTTHKSRVDVQEQLDVLRSGVLKEEVDKEARARGTSILLWLYKMKTGNESVGIHLVYGYERVVPQEEGYSTFDQFRTELGFIPFSLPQSAEQEEEAYQRWLSVLQDEKKSSNERIVAKAFAVIDALSEYRQALPTYRILIPGDRAGFMSRISGVLQDHGASMLELHGVADHYAEGSKPAIIEFCVAEGSQGSQYFDALYVSLMSEVGREAKVEFIKPEIS